MREPSSDQSGGEQRCCISSDADGRILTTSFPQFSHPHSIRPVPDSFYTLEQFDSENTGTAIAQVGRAGSPVPFSQKAENLRFHRWLDQPSSPISSRAAVEGSRVSLTHRPSPGISEIRRPGPVPALSSPPMAVFMTSEAGQANPSDSRGLDKLLSSSDSSEILSRYEELVSRLRRLEQLAPPVPRDLPIGPTSQTNTEESSTGGFKGHEDEVCSLTSSQPPMDSRLPGTEARGQASGATGDAEILGYEHTPPGYPSSPPPLAVQQTCLVSDGTDPDEAWKTFLIGDEGSEEIGKAAFEEARQQAARSFQLPAPSVSSDDRSESDGNSNVATVGTLYTKHDNETLESTDGQSSTGARASLEAAYDVSSRASEAGSPLDNSDDSVRAPSIEVNLGTSSVSGAEIAIDISETSGARPEDAGGSDPVCVRYVDSSTSEPHAGAPSTTTSMAVAPARSDAGPSETNTTAENFRFAHPKLFVGSRSGLSQPPRVTGPSVGISLTKKRRSRPKKRANDGRADIRGLPNYSSDPIEEFEEEGQRFREGRAPKSLFPALELT